MSLGVNFFTANSISTLLLGLLLFSTYVGNITPFGIKYLSLSYISIFIIVSFVIIFFSKLKIKLDLATEVLFGLVFVTPLISNILNGGEIGQYFPIHLKMSFYSILTYYLLKMLLPCINLSNIEKTILVSGYLGCFVSLFLYIVNFGNISRTIHFGCTGGVRLTGAIGDDPNIAMYSLVLFNALCMTRKEKKYLLGWLLSSLVIVLSMSRGAILAMIFAFGVSFLFTSQRKIRLLQLKILSPLLISVFIFLSMNPVISKLAIRFSFNKLSDGAGRAQIWKDAFNTFQKNKFIGIGFGNTVNYNKKYYNSHFINHCTFLDYLVEGGPFNVFMCIFLHFWILYKLFLTKTIMSEHIFICISFIMFSVISTFLSGGLLRAPFAIFMALFERFTANKIIDFQTTELKYEK